MKMRVTDKEWEFIQRYLSALPPEFYPAKSSCHKRFSQWSEDGSWTRLQKALVRLH